MEYSVSSADGITLFQLVGRFTFSDNQCFHELLEYVQKMDGKQKTIAIDFSRVEFIDSAGLGMLLLMRDECAARKLAVQLRGAQGQVKKMFDLSRFETLFDIQE